MKRKKLFTPVHLFDLTGLERFLDEQGKKRLFPLHCGELYCSFEEKEVPAGSRFRLVAKGKSKEPRGDMVQLYEESGWSYLFPISNIWFLFWCPDPRAPEPYTDPETQGYNVETLTKRIRSGQVRQAIVYLVLLLLFALMFILPPSRFDVQPVSPWIHAVLFILDFFGLPVFLLILLVVSNIISGPNYTNLVRLRKQLAEGLEQVSFPKVNQTRRTIAQYGILGLVILLLLANHLWGRPIPLEQASFPYLSLEEIEDVPMTSYEALFGPSSFHEDENQMERSFSLLSPVYYSTTRDGYELFDREDRTKNGSSPRGGEYSYTPSLDATYFHLTIPAMARAVADSKLDSMRLINLTWSYKDVSYPGTDFVILVSEPDGIWQMAAVANGGKLVVIQYGGLEQLADHLDKLVALVE